MLKVVSNTKEWLDDGKGTTKVPEDESSKRKGVDTKYQSIYKDAKLKKMRDGRGSSSWL
jgi:hypothetical protein